GRNNDFVHSGGDPEHPDFHRVTGEADEDAGGWLGDVIWGGSGDDAIEGGHGNDLIYGDAPASEAGDDEDDNDDIVGGGSADDGVLWEGSRLGAGVGLLDGHDVIHGDRGLAEEDGHDVLLGDNGWIHRTEEALTGDGPERPA